MHRFSDYINNSVKTIFIPEIEEYGSELLAMIEDHKDIHFMLANRYQHWIDILGKQCNGGTRSCKIYMYQSESDKQIPLKPGKCPMMSRLVQINVHRMRYRLFWDCS